MTLTIEVTPAEEAQLRQMAAARGKDQIDFAAHALRVGVATLAGTEGEQAVTEQAEVDRLVSDVKAGDKDAWLQLLLLTPVVDRTNPETGQPYPPLPEEALWPENIYGDRT